jgi:hypothetical protein
MHSSDAPAKHITRSLQWIKLIDKLENAYQVFGSGLDAGDSFPTEDQGQSIEHGCLCIVGTEE